MIRGRQGDRSSGRIDPSQGSFLAGTPPWIVILLAVLILMNAIALLIQKQYDTAQQ
jgi:hypothetical protein